MTVDAVLTLNEAGYYDFSIDSDGDIETADSFDTALTYSFFGERRASQDEVVAPQLRRGWVGNIYLYPESDFENGSKIWLLYQSRLTRDTLNRLQDEATKAPQWMVDDDLAVSIDEVVATVINNQVLVDITIRRSLDKIVRRTFVVWENTGTN